MNLCSITSKYIGGFVGVYNSSVELRLARIINNYMSINSSKGTSYIGHLKSDKIYFKNGDSTNLLSFEARKELKKIVGDN